MKSAQSQIIRRLNRIATIKGIASPKINQQNLQLNSHEPPNQHAAHYPNLTPIKKKICEMLNKERSNIIGEELLVTFVTRITSGGGRLSILINKSIENCFSGSWFLVTGTETHRIEMEVPVFCVIPIGIIV